ncbi:MAG: inositol monophosphatase family protein, partial [Bacteroidota bacterium]|nr:inositol monophosphatase family protein [Bacteroidota bacterium]
PDQRKGEGVKVVASRSHLSQETEVFIKELKGKGEKIDLVPAGSSLKLCLIAEGKADVYPRMGPTMEWDIAAGHIIIVESGGSVFKLDDTPLNYNKPDLLNPWFVAKSKLYRS